MSNQSPYLAANYPGPQRPRMFNSKTAQVLWTLVPVLSIGFLAAAPFVAAAVKGVIRPWLAVVYIVAQVAVMAAITVAGDTSGVNWEGLLEILLVITAATHTALLDSDRVAVGK